MSRILFLQDLPILPSSGGAQMTDWMMFEEGIRRGHKLDLVHPNTFGNTDIDRADFAIISNAVTFPQQILSLIAQKKPYIVYSHDYFHCRYRSYMPLQDKCVNCTLVQFWSKIYLGSKLNIFLSPLHFKMHAILFPDLQNHPHLECPSPIDVDLFKPVETVEREPNTVLYVGPFCRYKGIDGALAFAKAKKEFKYTFMGFDIGGIEEPWKETIEAMGHKVLPPHPNHALPSIYNRFQYFIELPNGPMPAERVVAESYLCGCKLILNRNVGFASYDWFKDREQVRKHVSEAPQLFWETIEKMV